MRVRRRCFLAYVRLVERVRPSGIFGSRPAYKLARSLYLRLRVGRVVKITVDGEPWWVPVHDKYFTPALLMREQYEPAETRCVDEILRPGMTVLDVGAHVGYYACRAARLVGPRGRVYAVEPMPMNRRLLKRNLALRRLSWVVVLPVAASDQEGEQLLYLNAANSGDNRLAAHEDAGLQVRVRTACLDHLIPSAAVIHFIKMDVQGWEVHALRGMVRLIAANPRVVLLIEAWPSGLARAGSRIEELVAFCQHAGLSPYLIDAASGALVRAGLDSLLTASGPHGDAANVVFTAHP